MEFSCFSNLIHMLLRFIVSGLFEVRVAEYLESCPEPEPSSVNRFLKGLGRHCLTHVIHSQKQMIFLFCFGFYYLFFFSVWFFFSGNKMKLLQIKWDKDCSGFELKDFISTSCCCGRWDCYCVKSSDLRKQGSSHIISIHAHVWGLHTFYWTQTGNNIFDCIFMGPWRSDTRLAFQMYNLS